MSADRSPARPEDALLNEAAEIEGRARRTGRHPDVERYRDLRLLATALLAEREARESAAINADLARASAAEARLWVVERALRRIAEQSHADATRPGSYPSQIARAALDAQPADQRSRREA